MYEMQSLQLPDGTEYTFKYDCDSTINSTACSSPHQSAYYGLLTSMTLPAGATISYKYSNFTDATGSHYRWINGRTTPDGTTTYTPQIVNTCGTNQVNCGQSLTVQRPSGDNTVYTSILNGGAWSNEIDYYNGSVSASNLLAKTTRCYNFVTITQGTCTYSVGNGNPATGVQKMAETTVMTMPNSGTVSKTTQYAFDNYGNVSAIKENNYYTGSLPSTVDRTTTISYLATTPYITANILNRPKSATVTNSSGATVAQTLLCYDYATGCGSSPLSPLSFASATGKTQHDDTNYGTSNTVRGDLTQIQRLVSGSTYLTKSMRYDMTGQLLQATDWSNLSSNTTSYSYTDNFVDGTPSGPTNAYPTTITAPLTAGNTTATYYFETGQLASVKDANGQTTSFTFNDLFNRLTNVSLPNGGWTIDQYDLQSNVAVGMETFLGISGSSSTSCSSCVHNKTKWDSQGRVVNSYLVGDPDGQTETDTAFDVNGRVKNVSNPYRTTSDPTYGLQTPSYDGLNRIVGISYADGNSVSTSYGSQIASALGQTSQQCASGTYGIGYPKLFIDEVGNRREIWVDGFGRVIETDEPTSSKMSFVPSCFTYDLNNNLTGVLAANGTQTRTYGYDLLSRLTSRIDPEAKSTTTTLSYTNSGGTVCSGDPGAVCQRTDGRSITTTYTYDALNRLTGKSYSDGVTPPATYSYDSTSCLGLSTCFNLGRRTGMSDGPGSAAWAYDSVGNILKTSRTTSSVTKTIAYVYNLDSSPATITYPGGRIVTYNIGNAERPTWAKDTTNSINYALSATYAPPGGLASVQNGSNLNSTIFYNNRLELCRYSVKSSGNAPASCTDTTVGNVMDFTFAYGETSFYSSGNTYNNGNLVSQANNVSGASGRSQSYTYDPLNRLLTAQSAATSGGDCWGQGFGSYNATPPTLPLADDALNNISSVTSLKCSSPAPNWSVNGYNQISNSGYTYGNSGGDTADGGSYTYTYDAENHITSVVTGGGTYCYAYDGDGYRVQKGTASSSCSSPSATELYWRNIGGTTTAETDGSGSTTNSSYNEYVFFAGRRIAQSNPSSGNVYYYLGDELGNTRIVTNASGTPCYKADFLPYGTENTPSGFTNSCSTNYKFTGYERDSETGNDYAFARYYSQKEMRFLSPDPLTGDVTDPQTLNKYTYVRNNPVNLIDPTGMLLDIPTPGDPGGLGDCGPDECTPYPWGIGGGECDFCGNGAGGNAGLSQPNSFPAEVGKTADPTSPGENPADDPFGGETVGALGCEVLGMPCGMPFPSGGGGINPSGCTYGSGSCGGMIYGLTDDQGNAINFPGGFMDFFASLFTFPLFPTPEGQLPPLVTPPPTLQFRPPSWSNFFNDFLPCYGAQLINQFFGDDDKALWTGAFTVGALTGNPIGIAGLMAWEIQGVGRAGMACAVASRGVWQ